MIIKRRSATGIILTASLWGTPFGSSLACGCRSAPCFTEEAGQYFKRIAFMRAEQEGWRLRAVDYTENRKVHRSDRSDQERAAIINETMNSIAVIAKWHNSKSDRLLLLSNREERDSIRVRIIDYIRKKILPEAGIGTSKIRWNFANIRPFDTIAIVQAPRGAPQFSILFEPILYLVSEEFKIGQWQADDPTDPRLQRKTGMCYSCC